MPSSYTAPIHDGQDITFEQFALRCSRAMGAAIHQRDDGMDVEIEEREVDGYYADRVAAASKALDAAEAKATEQWQAERDAKAAEIIAYNAELRVKSAAMADRYDGMIAQVEAWKPPTGEHVGLKEFMLQQLRESRQFDVSDYQQPLPPEDVESYRATEIAGLARSLAYANEHMAKENEQVRSQNEWVRALRDSLAVTA